MRILLDTHILLWWLADDELLSEGARSVIADASNEIVVSAATAWEVVIKQVLGKLTFDGDLQQEIEEQGFTRLPINFEHALQISSLPAIHRDPFDRMLVAQARVEKLQLLTVDRNILQYPVNVVEG